MLVNWNEERHGGGDMKKKTILIITVVLIILVTVLLILQAKRRGETEISPTPTPTIALPEIGEDVEVNLTSRYDKKAVILTISQIPPETTSIDYELSYETGERLPRGVLGTIHLEGEDDVKREILLGTCSRNVCVYDTGVEKISLVLKFNSPEGSSQFQKDYEL